MAQSPLVLGVAGIGLAAMLASVPAAAGTAAFNPVMSGKTVQLTRMEARVQFNNAFGAANPAKGEDQWMRGTNPANGLDYEFSKDINPKVGGVQASLFNKDIGFELSFQHDDVTGGGTFNYTLSDFNGPGSSSLLTLKDESDFNLIRVNFRSLGTNGGTNTISFKELAFSSGPGLTVSTPPQLVTFKNGIFQDNFRQQIYGTNGTMLSDYDWTVSGKVSVTGANAKSDPKAWIVTGNLSPNAPAPAMATMASAVPEPQSYALMLAGLAAVGAIAYRHKRV